MMITSNLVLLFLFSWEKVLQWRNYYSCYLDITSELQGHFPWWDSTRDAVSVEDGSFRKSPQMLSYSHSLISGKRRPFTGLIPQSLSRIANKRAPIRKKTFGFCTSRIKNSICFDSEKKSAKGCQSKWFSKSQEGSSEKGLGFNKDNVAHKTCWLPWWGSILVVEFRLGTEEQQQQQQKKWLSSEIVVGCCRSTNVALQKFLAVIIAHSFM